MSGMMSKNLAWIVFVLCIIYADASKYFIGSRNFVNYTDAINVCLNDGGILATINNENDHIIASNVCGTITDCWFGLNSINNENVWEYMDGTSVNGAYGFDINGNPTVGIGPWLNGQPDYHLNNEHCVHLAVGLNNQWNDRGCWFNYLRALCMRVETPNINVNKYIEWNFKDKSVYLSDDAWSNNDNNCDATRVYLSGDAELTLNGLECNNNGVGYIRDGINKTFNEKSLEVYVYRRSDTIHSGGAISIDMTYEYHNGYQGLQNGGFTINTTEHQFDSIEYWENIGVINQYSPGSDYSRRSFNGDNGATKIYDINVYEHLVAVYDTDNSIKLYYNGELYTNFSKNHLVTFNSDLYRLLFCKKHGPVLDSTIQAPTFDGIIIKAAIYDYPLSSDDVVYLYENRNVSTGQHKCDMLIPEIKTLDICDDINLSFNIKINEVIPNEWVFVIGSSPKVNADFDKRHPSIFLSNNHPIVLGVFIRTETARIWFPCTNLPDNFGVLGKEYYVDVRITQQIIDVFVIDLSNNNVSHCIRDQFTSPHLTATNVTFYKNELRYFNVTNATVESCVTSNPSNVPSVSPSQTPTKPPSTIPSVLPSISPSQPPTQSPSISPSISPSKPPSHLPSKSPSTSPTNADTDTVPINNNTRKLKLTIILLVFVIVACCVVILLLIASIFMKKAHSIQKQKTIENERQISIQINNIDEYNPKSFDYNNDDLNHVTLCHDIHSKANIIREFDNEYNTDKEIEFELEGHQNTKTVN